MLNIVRRGRENKNDALVKARNLPDRFLGKYESVEGAKTLDSHNGEGEKIISIVMVMSCLIQIIITRKVARPVVLVVLSIDNT
jgi:p-aminobenzoyl-glutamate transporter AbgT